MYSISCFLEVKVNEVPLNGFNQLFFGRQIHPTSQGKQYKETLNSVYKTLNSDNTKECPSGIHTMIRRAAVPRGRHLSPSWGSN